MCTLNYNIIYTTSCCAANVVRDYNYYQCNASGLANTLLQSSFFTPHLKSSKVKNLFFTGQLTVPGPGVPPSIISGKLVADLIENTNP